MIHLHTGMLVKAAALSALLAGLAGCHREPMRPPMNMRFPDPTVETAEAQHLSPEAARQATPASIIADVPTTPTAIQPGPAVPLTLADVLQTTLANNLNVRLQEIQRQNARDGIVEARGIYDLLLRANAERSQSGRTTAVRTTTDRFSAGASQLIPSGGVISLDYINTRSDIRSRSATGSLGTTVREPQSVELGITQPLLRDAGMAVTNAPIHIAKNNEKITLEEFRNQVMLEVAASLKAYWDLVFTVNNLDVQKVSLAQAQELLRTNQVKYETGWSPITDVLQAQAQVASREEQILVAQKQIQDIMDDLKRRMNVPEAIQEWQLQFIPLQKPTFFEVNFDEMESLRIALEKRPEALQADLALRNDEISQRVARNQRLPILDLTGTLDYLDAGGGADDDIDSWSAGLAFQYPLQNRAARARYRQAAANVEAGQIAIEATRQAILQEVRTALRAVRTARERIDVTRAAIDYETEKLESERERYDVGISTSFQVLEFQEDYAIAQVNYLLAVVDYNKALIDFELARGTLLDELKVSIEPYGVSKPGRTDFYDTVNEAADRNAAFKD